MYAVFSFKFFYNYGSFFFLELKLIVRVFWKSLWKFLRLFLLQFLI